MFVYTKQRKLIPDTIEAEIEQLERQARDLRMIHEGRGPTPAELASAPVLDQWRQTFRPVVCLSGEVTEHPVLDGLHRPIITSEILCYGEDQGWVRTHSRWYRLGEPAGYVYEFGG